MFVADKGVRLPTFHFPGDKVMKCRETWILNSQWSSFLRNRIPITRNRFFLSTEFIGFFCPTSYIARIAQDKLISDYWSYWKKQEY